MTHIQTRESTSCHVLPAVTIEITRENVERLLDAGVLYAAMTNGRWWQCRRNGATQRWKTMPERIRIPVKCGWKRYSAITEEYFINGTLDETFFRHHEDTPNAQ